MPPKTYSPHKVEADKWSFGGDSHAITERTCCETAETNNGFTIAPVGNPQMFECHEAFRMLGIYSNQTVAKPLGQAKHPWSIR